MTEGWMQVIAIMGTNLVIMLTFFGISISLYKTGIDQTNSFKDEVQREIKDFHGRLCAIEERNKGK